MWRCVQSLGISRLPEHLASSPDQSCLDSPSQNKPYSSIEKINYGFSGSLQLAQARMIEAWQSYNRQRQEFPEVFPGNLMPLKRIGPAIDY